MSSLEQWYSAIDGKFSDVIRANRFFAVMAGNFVQIVFGNRPGIFRREVGNADKAVLKCLAVVTNGFIQLKFAQFANKFRVAAKRGDADIVVCPFYRTHAWFPTNPGFDDLFCVPISAVKSFLRALDLVVESCFCFPVTFYGTVNEPHGKENRREAGEQVIVR